MCTYIQCRGSETKWGGLIGKVIISGAAQSNLSHKANSISAKMWADLSTGYGGGVEARPVCKLYKFDLYRVLSYF